MTTTLPKTPRQTEPLTTPRATSPNGDSGRELAAELARLRERFAAYEHLDKQLDEMVTGLTELLQGATELRRRTNKDIVEALARCETLIATDRAHHHDLLAALLNEIDAAQSRATALTTAVSGLQNHLADLTRRLPAGTTVGSAVPTAPAEPASTAATRVQMAIRGVPSVATALTLQRFVAGLAPVVAIQTREFATGEFRLQLELTGPFPTGDLARLPSGTLTVVEAKPDRLVLHYDAPATT